MKFVLLESFPTKRVVVVVVVLVVVVVVVVIVVILYLKIRGGSWVTLVSSIIRLAFIPLFMVWINKLLKESLFKPYFDYFSAIKKSIAYSNLKKFKFILIISLGV